VSIYVIQFTAFVSIYKHISDPHNSIPVKKEMYAGSNIPDTFIAFCSVTQKPVRIAGNYILVSYNICVSFSSTKFVRNIFRSTKYLASHVRDVGRNACKPRCSYRTPVIVVTDLKLVDRFLVKIL
jgi:hypothetical protein